MKTNPLKEGVVSNNFAAVGTVTERMVRDRAAELAVINGRSVQEVSKADLEQAQRELTGKPDEDPNQALLEAAPESARWDPLPGSTGGKVEVDPGEDEDEEGRSDQERLVQEGVDEAEQDQARQASKLKP